MYVKERNLNELIKSIKRGRGCDECPLYYNRFCGNFENNRVEPFTCYDVFYEFLIGGKK